MIRRWVDRMFTRNLGDGERLVRTLIREGGRPDNWLDRCHSWHVRKYGEYVTPNEPWYVHLAWKPLLWLTDWRSTWAQRPPTPKWPTRITKEESDA